MSNLVEKIEMEVVLKEEEDFFDEFGDRLEEDFKAKREEILTKDERGLFINTPLNCLRRLARVYNIIIAFSNNRIVEKSGLRRSQWVCIITVGLWEGVGRSPVEQVSKELAAADILEKLKISGYKDKIEAYGMPPGFRICPTIFRYLNNVCEAKGFRRPHYKAQPLPAKFELTLLEPTISDLPHYYNIECKVEGKTTLGYSDDLHVAKLWAAKKMVELLMGEGFNVPFFKIRYGPPAFLGFLSQPLTLSRHTPRVKKFLDNEKKRTGVPMPEENKIIDDFTLSDDDDEDFKIDTNPNKVVQIKVEDPEPVDPVKILGDINIDDLFPPQSTSTSQRMKRSSSSPDVESQIEGEESSESRGPKRLLRRFYTPTVLPESFLAACDNSKNTSTVKPTNSNYSRGKSSTSKYTDDGQKPGSSNGGKYANSKLVCDGKVSTYSSTRAPISFERRSLANSNSNPTIAIDTSISHSNANSNANTTSHSETLKSTTERRRFSSGKFVSLSPISEDEDLDLDFLSENEIEMMPPSSLNEISNREITLRPSNLTGKCVNTSAPAVTIDLTNSNGPSGSYSACSSTNSATTATATNSAESGQDSEVSVVGQSSTQIVNLNVSPVKIKIIEKLNLVNKCLPILSLPKPSEGLPSLDSLFGFDSDFGC